MPLTNQQEGDAKRVHGKYLDSLDRYLNCPLTGGKRHHTPPVNWIAPAAFTNVDWIAPAASPETLAANRERFCRILEEHMGITEQDADDFRRQYVLFVDTIKRRDGKCTFRSNPRMAQAIMKFLGLPENAHVEIETVVPKKRYRTIDDV